MICYYCKESFDSMLTPGGLLIAPPLDSASMSPTFKYHVCVVCWKWLENLSPPPPGCAHLAVAIKATNADLSETGACLNCGGFVVKYPNTDRWIED